MINDTNLAILFLALMEETEFSHDIFIFSYFHVELFKLSMRSMGQILRFKPAKKILDKNG